MKTAPTSPFSPASEDSTLPPNERDSAPSPASNVTPIAKRCSDADSQVPLFTTTFAPSSRQPAWRASFQAASHARTSATPDMVPALMESAAGCSMSSRESLASWDRTSLCWRTSQRCLLEEWARYSEPFPISGSMRNGQVFPRAPWALHTCDTECSLWPTPTASMDGRGFGIPLHKRSGRYRQEIVLRVQELVTANGWRIHPHFTETLMGLPLGWTEIEPSETQSIPTRPRRSTRRSQV